MEDAQLLQHIKELVDEEHHLETRHVGQPLSDDEQSRLHRIEVELDQCWDLLRQRRARRSSGQDPDQAAVRPETVVENYLQ